MLRDLAPVSDNCCCCVAACHVRRCVLPLLCLDLGDRGSFKAEHHFNPKALIFVTALLCDHQP